MRGQIRLAIEISFYHMHAAETSRHSSRARTRWPPGLELGRARRVLDGESPSVGEGVVVPQAPQKVELSRLRDLESVTAGSLEGHGHAVAARAEYLHDVPKALKLTETRRKSVALQRPSNWVLIQVTIITNFFHRFLCIISHKGQSHLVGLEVRYRVHLLAPADVETVGGGDGGERQEDADHSHR